VAYILDREFGFDLPKLMHPEVGSHVGGLADRLGKELSPAEIHAEFRKQFVNVSSPLALLEFQAEPVGKDTIRAKAKVSWKERTLSIEGEGNGPISAFVHALAARGWATFTLRDYRAHALSSGEESSAAAYVSIQTPKGSTVWGCGVDPNIELAGLHALVSAVNRSLS
jgi:2-isopropylmalate synthase